MSIREIKLVPDLQAAGLSFTTNLVNNNYCATINCYYEVNKVHALLPKTYLDALNIQKGSAIVDLGWYSSERGQRVSLRDLRFKARHYNSTTLPTSFLSSATFDFIKGDATYGEDFPMSLVAVGDYTYYGLDKPFVWNGKDNIVFEFTRVDTSWEGQPGLWRVINTATRQLGGYRADGRNYAQVRDQSTYSNSYSEVVDLCMKIRTNDAAMLMGISL